MKRKEPPLAGRRGHCSVRGVGDLSARGAQQKQQEAARDQGKREGAIGGRGAAAHPGNIAEIPRPRKRGPHSRGSPARRCLAPGIPAGARTGIIGRAMNAPRSRATAFSRYADAGLLVACLLAAVGASLRLGQDANWDLQNYHFYDPWAWLAGRIFDWDMAAAQLQTFHNPLADIPFYALVAWRTDPRLITAWLALPTGVAAYVVAKIAWTLFADLASVKRIAATLASLAIGFTGAMGVGQLGGTTGEWPVAALTLVALWLLLRAGDDANAACATWILLAAGAIAGIASGLKLTAATYALALWVALLARRGTLASRARAATLYACGVAAGLAIALGPWSVELWTHFGNPLFPYGNEWIRSPWWDAAPVLPRQYGPHTAIDAVLLPFRILAPPPGFVCEVPYVDARLPLLYALALAAVAAPGAARLRGASPGASRFATTAERWRFVGVFFGASFVIWAFVHSILRYTIPLETLSGVLIVGLTVRLLRPRLAIVVIAAVAIGVIETTLPSEWGRVRFGPAWFDVRVPPVEPHALVLLAVDAPMAYVLPFLPPDARHVGIRNNVNGPERRNRLARTIAEIVREQRGPLYSLAFPAGAGEADLLAHRLRRVAGGCTQIVTNMPTSPIELCRLERVTTAAQ